jgi:hypothetical protein
MQNSCGASGLSLEVSQAGGQQGWRHGDWRQTRWLWLWLWVRPQRQGKEEEETEEVMQEDKDDGDDDEIFAAWCSNSRGKRLYLIKTYLLF